MDIKTATTSVDVAELDHSKMGEDEGTAIDQQDMWTLGRIQEMRRNFKFLPVLGFGCTLIGTWQFLLGTVQFGLMDGGTAGLIYGYIASLAGFVCVYLSIAEMASMAPTSGGQYHWVSEFAPASIQKYLSYLSGWLVFAAWQFAIVDTAFLAGTIIQGLLVLNLPDYQFERWQGTLLVIAVTAFAIMFNVFLAKRLPLVEGLLLIIYMLGFFAIIIPLWVLAPRASTKSVFTDFNNGGGWSSMGTAVMVGLTTTLSSLSGFDCAVHMAEEIHDASRTLPLSIVWGIAINGVMGLVTVITLGYTVGDLNVLLASPTKFPFIQLFYNVTDSLAATNFLTSITIIVFVSSVISEVATSARQLWSFARDGGFPFASTLAKVHKTRKIPVNAVIVSFVLVCVTSLINIGSTEALNAVVAITMSSQLASYILTIACVLWKRVRCEPLPVARWSLGRFGMAINIASLVFLLPVFVFTFFPLATPVTAGTLNWDFAVCGVLIILSTVYYFVGGRARYVPPSTLVRRADEDYEVKR